MKIDIDFSKWGQAFRTALAIVITLLVIILFGIKCIEFGIMLEQQTPQPQKPTYQTGIILPSGDEKALYLAEYTHTGNK